MMNAGYKEIDKSECPVVWGKKRKVIYLNKENRYAMVDQHGQFVHWEHPKETESVKSRYQYKKPPKIETYKSSWKQEMEDKYWESNK
jgi:hypothetical protein